MEYGNSFEIAESRGVTMKENGVNAEEMIEQAAIQLARSKYLPSFGTVSHPSALKYQCSVTKIFIHG